MKTQSPVVPRRTIALDFPSSAPHRQPRASSSAAKVSNARPHVALIIPAMNEEESIGHVLKAVPCGSIDTVIVVDNGSTDRTSQVARENGARIIVQPERGYGAACMAGIAALPKETAIVVFLDADYSDYPEEIENLLNPLLRDRADMVIGTRTRTRASRSALAPQQRWGNLLATTLLRWRYGFRYTDLGPFRAIRRESLAKLGMTDRDFGWTVEMQIKAVRHGLRIAEVPVRYRIRIGRSKISGTVKGTILAGTKILYTIFKQSWR